MKRIDADAIYDENVDYDALEQHTYADSGKHIFYTCPRCGNEYLATFITDYIYHRREWPDNVY